MKNLLNYLKILLGLILFVIVIETINIKIYKPSKNLYNISTKMENNYKEIVKEQFASWDRYYNEFIDHHENVRISKETFLEVINIIMSNREDGQNLSWKWVSENQKISYNEFTELYKYLTSFISTGHKFNKEIEVEKQNIVKEHNIMLATFPNNMYNKILKRKNLEYSAEFLTEETRKLFKIN